MLQACSLSGKQLISCSCVACSITCSSLVLSSLKWLQKGLYSQQNRSALVALGSVEPALLCLDTTHLAGSQVNQSVPSRSLPHCFARVQVHCARAVPAP